MIPPISQQSLGPPRAGHAPARRNRREKPWFPIQGACRIGGPPGAPGRPRLDLQIVEKDAGPASCHRTHPTGDAILGDRAPQQLPVEDEAPSFLRGRYAADLGIRVNTSSWAQPPGPAGSGRTAGSPSLGCPRTLLLRNRPDPGPGPDRFHIRVGDPERAAKILPVTESFPYRPAVHNPSGLVRPDTRELRQLMHAGAIEIESFVLHWSLPIALLPVRRGRRAGGSAPRMIAALRERCLTGVSIFPGP